MRRVLAVGALVLAAGCGSLIGLSDFDIVDDADGGLDGAPPDTNAVAPASSDGGEDAGGPVALPPVTCIADAGTCATLALDGGWRPVAMAPGTATCPAGFGAASFARGMPTAAPGACDCAVTTTPPTSCADTSATLSFLDGNTSTSCASAAGGKVRVETGCASTQGIAFGSDYAALVPPAAQGASCTATVVSDASKVTTTALTLCPPADTCSDAVCAGEKLGALRSCVVADGDVACPTARFTQKIPIGDAIAGVTCTGCTCTVTSATCGGAFEAYPTTSTCSDTPVVIEAGVCTNVAHLFYRSFRYTPAPAATATADGGRAMTGTTFSGARTLCCAP